MKRFLPIIAIFAAILMGACSSSGGTYTNIVPSAKVTSMMLYHDSIPYLSSTYFKVLELADTGLIANEDSIRYGTNLEKIRTVFSFETTPGLATLHMGDTTFYLKGRDTIDYTKKPIYLTVESSDGKQIKTYEIRVNAHQVDPDLYVWKTLTAQAYEAPMEGDQQLLLFGGMFYLYVGTGDRVYLYTSTDGSTWQPRSTDLPTSCRVRSIIADDSLGFYYAEGSQLLQSTDGQQWTNTLAGGATDSLVTMLFCFPAPDGERCPWLLAEDEDPTQWQLQYMQGGQLVNYQAVSRLTFPTSGFSCVPFSAVSERPRVLLLGGYMEDGSMSSVRWNWEYIPGRGVRMATYTNQRSSFPAIAHSSVVWYNNQLMLFGSIDSVGTYQSRTIYQSTDEGLNWTEMDTTKCVMPQTFQSRKKVSAQVCHDGLDLIVAGGSDNMTTYRDVYMGRVQSIGWDKK